MHSVKGVNLSTIYSENVIAKVVQVAQRGWRQQVWNRELLLPQYSRVIGTLNFISAHRFPRRARGWKV
jgi:hypothetical protein